MRMIPRFVVLAAATFCATAAFAASKAVVNIPFNFESKGESFPAGQYVVTLESNDSILGLTSMTNPKLSAHWTAGPADYNPNKEMLTLKFDDLGSTHHTLRTMQLGPRITSRLDAPARHHDAGSIVAPASGQ